MLLMIDNYDSFTYNLVQYFGELGQQVEVLRNDVCTIADIKAKHPAFLVISPGPCTPSQAGSSLELIRFFSGKIPILGVCLGHQCIGEAFGGKTLHAKQLMHGKTDQIVHQGQGIFKDMPNPFTATRYHSLIVGADELPTCLQATAYTQAGELMAIEHKHEPTIGLQFHPESISTEQGHRLLKNFLNYK